MRVTVGEIMAAQTPSGGWTREALAVWGVSWPPPKGWKEALIAGSLGPSAKLWLDRARPIIKSDISHLYWETDIPLKEIADAYGIDRLQLVADAAGEAVMRQYACKECKDPIIVGSRSAAETLVRETARHERYLSTSKRFWPSLIPTPCCKTCKDRLLYESARPAREELEQRQHRARELGRMPYQDYLQTAEWQQRRRDALKRAKYSCQTCSAKDELHVHHRTYIRRGMEHPSDLIVLCAGCHSLFHQNARLAEGGRAA